MSTTSSWRLEGRALVRERRSRDSDTALGSVEQVSYEAVYLQLGAASSSSASTSSRTRREA